MVIPPDDLSIGAVDTQQFTIGRDKDHTLLTLRIGRDTELLGELVLEIAKLEVLQILGDRVVIIKAILIGLNPIVLLRIEMNAFNASDDSLLVQPACRRTIHLFRHGVIHGVVHTLFQPEPSAIALLYLVHTIVPQRGCILVV